MKIAVVSPDITNLGGISRCVVVLIDALNKKGIIPDYYGIYSNTDKVYELFNRKIEYNFKRIIWGKRMRLYSSWMKNLQLLFKEYDYVFDFTNTLPLNVNKGKYLSYILYPEFLTSRGKYNKGLWKVYYKPHQILAFFRKNKFKEPDVDIVCVSKKVSDLIFKLFEERYPVLYPPANLEDFKNKISKKSGIVSVGGLTHEKNQLEQFDIANNFPDLEFSICGSSKRNPSYHKELKKVSQNINNVKLCPDISFKELKEKLSHAEVFINSGREDPFCMAIIEGIAAGCIPLIHDSGGVVEIVPFKELRYTNLDDAVLKLKKILKLTEIKKKELRIKLNKHVEQFGEKQFVKTLFNYMNKQNI